MTKSGVPAVIVHFPFVIGHFSLDDSHLLADKYDLLESSPQLLLRVRGHQVDTDYNRRRG